MSMDDFVVTYFTKGAGINTLSTMIYGELKRGIKPEMYALSTLIFAVVLIDTSSGQLYAADPAETNYRAEKLQNEKGCDFADT